MDVCLGLPHSRPSDANFTCTAHSLGTRNNCHEQTSSSSSLFFWQSCSWQVVKQSAVSLLGGAAVRPTAANNAFYLTVKASVEEAEAATQDEAQPDDHVAIMTQTQQFKQDITRHNRRSIHHYCLIGRNLNALKIKKKLSPAASALDYSPRHIQFLINLYKLSSYYTKIKRITVGIRELKTNFKALRKGVMDEKDFWR